MQTLTDPCLPDSWNVYSAYAGLFAMLAALAMQLLEFLANQKFRSMTHKPAPLTVNHDGQDFMKKDPTNHEIVEYKSDEHTHHHNGMPEHIHYHAVTPQHTHHHIGTPQHTHHHIGTPEHIHYHAAMPEHTHHHAGMPEHTHHHAEVPEHTHHHAEIPEHTDGTTGQPEPIDDVIDTSEQTGDITDNSDQIDDTTNKSEKIKESAVPEKKDTVVIEVIHVEPQITVVDFCETSGHSHGMVLHDDAQRHKISTYLLEFGIATHSVLIGLTLGTTTDSFVALFIALCFHQFFEAMALGAQIANIKNASLRSAIVMVLFFTVTTPIGIAIGIGIHAGTYNPESVVSLLVTGILDSLAAGILIYVALVNLINAEMGPNAHGFYALSTRLKLLYFGALYLGVAAMSVIGRWA
jgi:zinc transporter ZupT